MSIQQTVTAKATRKMIMICTLVFVLLSINANGQISKPGIYSLLFKFHDTVKSKNINIGVKEYHFNGKTIILYGTRHTYRRLEDQQYKDMSRIITSVKPTLILTEGNVFAPADISDAVKYGGEPSFCRYLTYKEIIEIANWDAYWGRLLTSW